MRVAVLGAGYAGLTLARRLERTLPEGVELVVVNDTPDHLVQHEIHRVIRRPSLADVITVSLSDVLTDATIREATVTAVDTEKGVATLDTDGGEEEELEYDFAAVCLGAETEFYGLEDIKEYATPLKRLEDAESIRSDAFEGVGGQAVIGGAGLSGIQTAGELAELSEEEDLDLDVTLVEMAEQVAPGFDETMAEAIREELQSRDVQVETGVAIESADEETVHLGDGQSLSADVFVWTGGIRGPGALGHERPRTRSDLRVSESTFVVGDAADVTDEAGNEVPATAQTATREASVVATNIDRLVSARTGGSDGPVTIPVSEDGDNTEKADTDTGNVTGTDLDAVELAQYNLSVAGWVISVGDGAVAKVGPFVFSGEPARATKAVIGGQHLSSVGAVGQASQLVAEELGWPTEDKFGIAAHLGGKSPDSLPIDLARSNEQFTEFVQVAAKMSDTFAPGETIDLTPFTRQTDWEHSKNTVASLQKLMFDSAETAIRGLFGGSDETDDDEFDIEVTDESSDDGGEFDGNIEVGDESDSDDDEDE